MAKVLLVDDAADVRRSVRRALIKLGHEVWDVPDGSDALPLLDVVSFDLVITDAYMAGVDGMELLVRIQQRGNPVPVVMISGGGHLPRERVLAMAQGCGAVATIEKPFTTEQLRQTIDPLLAPPPARRP